jgi:hypothetical protein
VVSVPGETERGNAPKELPCPFRAKLRNRRRTEFEWCGPAFEALEDTLAILLLVVLSSVAFGNPGL